ncbi:hypothetical protein ACT4WO_19750 (plasmid) [Acinetobacter baumannii]
MEHPAFKDKSWIDNKNGKAQSSLILGEEVDDVVVKAAEIITPVQLVKVTYLKPAKNQILIIQ